MKTRNRNRTFTLAAVPAMVVALVACGASNASSQAESLYTVKSIYVEGDECAHSVTDQLAEYDFGVTTDPQSADSTLRLDVTPQGRNLDEVPEFGGFGHRATYTASLIGADNKVLFSTSGDEGSVTYEEMCEDIGDEIAARMEDRRDS